MEYDKLSRMTLQDGEYETTTWTYNTTPGKLGQLTSVTMNNGTAQSYNYDALGRMTSQTVTVSGQEFTKSYSYDSYGRVQTENWNTGFGIMYQYNPHGYLSHVKTQNDQLIWQGQAYNARGQLTHYQQGTNLQTQKFYNSYGFPAGEMTNSGSNTLNYTNCSFDSHKGYLTSRTDYLAGKTESFLYDGLNRLTNENVYNGAQLSTGFAPNGNITQKSDIGAYTYGAAGPHAVTGLTNTTGNLLPATDQTVDYTAFNKVSYIGQGNYDYLITYGPDRQRSRTVLMDGISEATLLTKYYAFGDYEKEITEDGTRHLHYISGGDGLAAIYVKYDNAPDSLYFILKDHLGSIVGAINEETGTFYRQSFDAWGRKRNPENWSYTNIPDFPFDRGYTGHEHLKWFGLVNMNGRLYDVALCRFLSPDPYVQLPDYTQSFNRYSYALNNPLIFSDPDGEWIHLAIGAILGGTINWVTHGAEFSLKGLGYFGVGAAAGALAAGVGAGVAAALAGNAAAGGGFVAGFLGTSSISSTGFVAGAISGTTAGVTNGLIMGTGNGMMSGQHFINAIKGGGLDQAWKQGIGGAVFGGLMGSLDAINSNEDWLTGSPYKRYAYTNGENIMTPDAAAGKNLTTVQKDASLMLPESDNGYSIEIKAPKGWKIENGSFEYSTSEKLYDLQHITENNSLLVEFPLGTPKGGYYAAYVSQPTSLLHNNQMVFFYSNNRDFSTLFWYLKLIIK